MYICCNIASGTSFFHFMALVCIRHGVNSIPELELMVNSNSGIGIDYLKTMELELWIGIKIEKFWIGIGIEVSLKKN